MGKTTDGSVTVKDFLQYVERRKAAERERSDARRMQMMKEMRQMMMSIKMQRQQPVI